MLVELTHPETKKRVEIQVDEVDVNEMKSNFEIHPDLTEEKLRRLLENLNVSADVKAILAEILKFSIKVGVAVLEIGKKIIAVILELSKKFPNTAAGLVVGFVIGALLSSIPVLGWLFGWLLMPLCTALGLALGAWKDLGDTELGDAIENVMNTVFSVLKRIPTPV